MDGWMDGQHDFVALLSGSESFVFIYTVEFHYDVVEYNTIL